MNVIHPAGDRRAQVALWHVPLRDAVVVFQQCAIQSFHGSRRGEIDGVSAMVIGLNKFFQGRVSQHQGVEIVTVFVRVIGVKCFGQFFSRWALLRAAKS